jgi:hypothetical protein
MSLPIDWSFGSDESVQFMISTDNGNTWTTLETWDQNNTPYAAGNNVSIDLSSYSGMVQFAFYMHEGGVYDGFRSFFVDNFSIVNSNVKPNYDTMPKLDANARVRQVDTNLFSVASDDETNISSIFVYDLSGRLIYRNDNINTTVYQVEINASSGNVYIFHIGMNNNSSMVTKKIVKQ